ncbi:hypothetical protein [Microbacterium aurantiacum]|uniref:hypothetical protein n=1 Tax=Microbacterium aurantiacum TaxID=162393 RepID=UPI003433FAFE
MAEEEIIESADQAVRVAVSSAQQVASQVARAKLHRGEKEMAAAQTALAAQSDQTKQIRALVSTDEFWRNATPESVTNAAVYGAHLAPHDRDALSIYSTVREGAQKRWGVDVDAIYGPHGGDLDAAAPVMRARLAAAMRDGIDDTLAARREDELANEAGREAGIEEGRAEAAEQESVDVVDGVDDENGREMHEQRAEEFYDERERQAARADAYRGDAASADAEAATLTRGGTQARARAERTFPDNVGTAINRPTSTTTATRPARTSRSRTRTAELSR